MGFISVKHQLSNIYDVIDTIPKRAELASIPNVDLRIVIRNQLSSGASFQMQDMFVNSATIKFADTEIMPWHNGRSFKELKVSAVLACLLKHIVFNFVFLIYM